MVLDLELELMLYAEYHVRFDESAGDAPTGGLYEVWYDAFEGGKNPRGPAGQCSLVTYWIQRDTGKL